MSKVSAVWALLIVTTYALAPGARAGLDGRDDPSTTSRSTRLAASLNQQELYEKGALERFEIDELFLPRLNVDLPTLFHWSSIESAYFA